MYGISNVAYGAEPMAGGGEPAESILGTGQTALENTRIKKKNRTLNEIETYLLLYIYVLFTAGECCVGRKWATGT